VHGFQGGCDLQDHVHRCSRRQGTAADDPVQILAVEIVHYQIRAVVSDMRIPNTDHVRVVDPSIGVELALYPRKDLRLLEHVEAVDLDGHQVARRPVASAEDAGERAAADVFFDDVARRNAFGLRNFRVAHRPLLLLHRQIREGTARAAARPGWASS